MNRIRKVSTTDTNAKHIKFQKMHGPPGSINTAILIGKEHSDNMSADLLVFEDTELTYTMPYDDMIYVIEGELQLVHEDTITIGEPGDVLYIPTGQTLTFRSKGKCVVFCATYPVNWEELTDLGE